MIWAALRPDVSKYEGVKKNEQNAFAPSYINGLISASRLCFVWAQFHPPFLLFSAHNRAKQTTS
jgi:hypothetical protein